MKEKRKIRIQKNKLDKQQKQKDDKAHQSFKLINNQSIGTIFGNISYTVGISHDSPGLFYCYSDYGLDDAQFGAGINLGNWFGVEVFATTPGDIGVGFQLTPWFHSSGQIGLSGIGISLGIDIGNTSHDISINIGWGTIATVAIAIVAAPALAPIAASLGWLFGF